MIWFTFCNQVTTSNIRISYDRKVNTYKNTAVNKASYFDNFTGGMPDKTLLTNLVLVFKISG